MHPSFWHDRWHSGQIGFHQAEVNPYLVRFWPQLQLTRGQRVFVPLCGKSRDMVLPDAALGEVWRAGLKARSSASTQRRAGRAMPFGWDEKAPWHARSIAR